MKHLAILSIGALALIASLSPANTSPLLANSPKPTDVALDFQRQPQFQFYLKAEKKIVQLNHPRKQYVIWQGLQGDAIVQRGDVIRYIVTGKNNSGRSLKYLVVTQPIPKHTIYILNSVAVKNNEAKLTYSIDNGRSFVEKPIVRVKLANGRIETHSAPAALYTHLRWNYSKLISPAAVVNTTFLVKVG